MAQTDHKRANAEQGESGKSFQEQSRTSSTAWMPPHSHSLAKKLYDRVSDLVSICLLRISLCSSVLQMRRGSRERQGETQRAHSRGRERGKCSEHQRRRACAPARLTNPAPPRDGPAASSCHAPCVTLTRVRFDASREHLTCTAYANTMMSNFLFCMFYVTCCFLRHAGILASRKDLRGAPPVRIVFV